MAVLLAEDGATFGFPRTPLPKGAKAGDLLALTIERDAGAIRNLFVDTRRIQHQLKETDPGGDIRR